MRVAGRGAVLGWVLTGWGCGFSAAGTGVGTTSDDDGGSGSSVASSDEASSIEGTSGGGGATGSTSGGGSTTTTPLDPDGTSTGAEESGNTSEGTTGGEPSCTTALLVAGDGQPNGMDAAIFTRLENLGLEVKIVDDDVAQASDASGTCVVVVSSTGLSTNINGEFRDVAVPVVTWEAALYPDLRMVAPNDPFAFGVVEAQSDIAIVDPAHPMAAGQAGVVSVFAGVGRVSWGIPQGQAQIVATLPLDPFRATIFGFEAGATMADGFIAPARRVGHCAATTTTPYSDPGFVLFDAAIAWALDAPG